MPTELKSSSIPESSAASTFAPVRMTLRSGRVYTMVARPYAVASTAHRYAEKLRPDKGDRLVLACEACPTTRPSKRRPMRWATVARQVAAAVGAEPAAVRRALATALAAERERSE